MADQFCSYDVFALNQRFVILNKATSLILDSQLDKYKMKNYEKDIYSDLRRPPDSMDEACETVEPKRQ